MCGIYGVIKINNNIEFSSLVKKMMKVSEYRGPDSQAIIEYETICMGFNRLSIIDLDDRSNQPFYLETIQKSIVFNGEIYNYIELKSDLEKLGYIFQTESDTEVVLTAFHEYNENAFNMFNGMWSICIVDHLNNEIILSRDRFGVKPLYYMYYNEEIYFASEMKSLLVVNEKNKINEFNKEQYLLMSTNKFKNYETIYENIYEHPPGQYSKVNNFKLDFYRYYDVPKQVNNENLEILISELKSTFKNAVEIRLRTDVEVALLLSGGLDSSSIAYQINSLIENKSIKQKKITAFTLNFGDFDENEWDTVQKFSKYIPNIEIVPLNISFEDFKGEIDNLIKIHDNVTLSISHIIHTVALREIKKRGFTVVLNGQGADEVFGGYFPADFGFLFLDLMKKSLTESIIEYIKVKKKWKFSHFKLVKVILIAFLSKNYKIRAFLKTGKLKMLKNDLNENNFENNNSFYSFRSCSQIFYTQFNGILNYEDISSMLNSIEMRSPFLDYRMVNIGLKLGNLYKLKDGYSKWILRNSIADELPDFIKLATFKLGYVVPKNILMEEIIGPNKKLNEVKLNKIWREYTIEILNSKKD